MRGKGGLAGWQSATLEMVHLVPSGLDHLPMSLVWADEHHARSWLRSREERLCKALRQACVRGGACEKHHMLNLVDAKAKQTAKMSVTAGRSREAPAQAGTPWCAEELEQQCRPQRGKQPLLVKGCALALGCLAASPIRAPGVLAHAACQPRAGRFRDQAAISLRRNRGGVHRVKVSLLSLLEEDAP